ncbi:MAG: hypothetical protein JXA73_08645 [Acidobacteria bacterium]|nr:hypothetical protein [Acidobacteriota bacterium]
MNTGKRIEVRAKSAASLKRQERNEFVSSVSSQQCIFTTLTSIFRRLPLEDAAVWASNSRSISFFDGYNVKKIVVSGGPAQVICEEIQSWEGYWNRDGEIIFNGFTLGLEDVSAAGGAMSVVNSADITRQESDHGSSSFLSDARNFVY